MEHNHDMQEGCTGHWCRHSAVRALTAVIVLIFVFWCGFEFGSMHEYARGGFVRGEYGPGMMGGWGYTTNATSGSAGATAATPNGAVTVPAQ